ncbi:spindle pole body component 110 [Medicago truncatula]|uniref:spindle pole body component 110 n=1 Tax=Medicago truncatula TaxID=3880 RepID=UPI000D2F188C|nr:spindle pole body component 110 [Medicago truncatula]
MAEQTEKTYLTNGSLVYEAASQREIEKEEIRQKILRQKELEEEVWRELAMERTFGTMQRSVDHIGVSQPSLIMAPPEIKHSTQIRNNKDKIILLAKPDMSLYSAKRKAVTQDVPSDEPSAIGLNKKLKEEWSCELCRINATSENGLNDHLNGKKHKAREARQKREIDKHNKKGQNTVIKVTDIAVNTTVSEVDAGKDQKTTSNCCIALKVMNENVVDTKSKNEEQLLETMVDNGESVAESKNEKELEEMTVDERVTESKYEEQLLETVLDNGVSLTESKNEKKLEEMTVDETVTESKNEKKLEEMTVDVSVTESKNEKKLEEMMVDETVTESKIEEKLLETVLDNGVSVTESKDEKKLEEMTVDERVTESKNEEKLKEMTVDERVTESKDEKKLEEMTVDERVTESKNEKKLEEMTVDEKVTESKNEEQHAEKNQNVDFFESKKGAATEEAGKSALTEMIKARGLWCELCQIGTNSQVVMERHIKGKKHIKKINHFNNKNASLSSTSFVSPHTTDGVKKETDQMMTHMTNIRDGI